MDRAFIAASRRTDRSLDARLESARRASEIHKSRTGKALCVTMESVINEEMYDEEDSDIPVRYRHLNAHLQTSSPAFNQRLSAYLTNTVAFRTALAQAAAGSLPNNQSSSPYVQNYVKNTAYLSDRLGKEDEAAATAVVPNTGAVNTPSFSPDNYSQQNEPKFVRAAINDSLAPFSIDLPANAAQMFPTGVDPVLNPDSYSAVLSQPKNTLSYNSFSPGVDPDPTKFEEVPQIQEDYWTDYINSTDDIGDSPEVY